MREHRSRLQKREVYLTFDLERDYVSSGYLDPPSFEGLRYNVPRILDKMDRLQAAGTFFVTPEVLENCEDLVKDIVRRHAVGLHSHVYYQREFKGWEQHGDCFRSYEPHEKRQMVLRDLKAYSNYIGTLELFRIGRLEPDHVVLRTVNEARCRYDSSYHARSYNLMKKMIVALSYSFQEIPVDFHLYGLEPRHMQINRSVILIHPLTPPGESDPQVYDESTFVRIVDLVSQTHEFKGLTQYRGKT